jgi:hypothetical protein
MSRLQPYLRANDVITEQRGWIDYIIVSAELGGGDAVNVNRTTVGAWETFRIVKRQEIERPVR